MHRIVYDIVIGSYRLRMVDSVVVRRSVETLTDTATIVLPGSYLNRSIDIENKIHVGDYVYITMGYDGRMTDEFQGYVQRVLTDGGSLTVECEDELWKLRKSISDKTFVGPDVKTIIEYVLREVGGGIGLRCDYSFRYDKFTIQNANGLDVLRKIREEASPNIYMNEGVLHVHPKYSQIFGNAVYDFAKNIDKDGLNLEWKRMDDVKVSVVVRGKDADGHVVEYRAGSTGGENVVKNFGSGVSSKGSLKLKAEEILKERMYEGYRGSFRGWLFPVCGPGWSVDLVDKDGVYRSGRYYVLSVETRIGRDGGMREIELGKRI